LFLQFMHLHAERGLADETGAGGAAEMTVARDGAHVFELSECDRYYQ